MGPSRKGQADAGQASRRRRPPPMGKPVASAHQKNAPHRGSGLRVTGVVASSCAAIGHIVSLYIEMGKEKYAEKRLQFGIDLVEKGPKTLDIAEKSLPLRPIREAFGSFLRQDGLQVLWPSTMAPLRNAATRSMSSSIWPWSLRPMSVWRIMARLSSRSNTLVVEAMS